MNPPKVNERWRVALAGLVAALAIPFLIIDSPAPAEGVETNGQDAASTDVEEELSEDPNDELAAEELAADEAEVALGAVEVVVVDDFVSPDILRLADHAGTWGAARSQAIADGRVEASSVPPPSNTNLALLPKLPRIPEPTPEEPVEEPAEPETPAEEPAEEPADPEAPTEEPEQPAEEPTDPEAPTEEPGEPEEPADPEAPTEEPEEPEEPVEEPTDPPVIEPETPSAPPVPAQVNGRVPVPAGGPTAAQWDAVRKCESTHNYRAISPSGLYRGAYQFSQQTWDWVAGIHQPHLVGIDPIDAEPAWQDIMAYTLYAMRGWDQWPICGKNLL